MQHTSPNGRTRLLGIVGHPVKQALAPALWTNLFSARGYEAVCVPFDVRPHNLGDFLSGISGCDNLDGLIITVPHKFEALNFASSLTQRARQVGAVNSMRLGEGGKWEADMLDGLGFVASFETHVRLVAGQRALVSGAGGVGSAIAFALAEAGAAEVAVFDIDVDRASSLVERLAGRSAATRVDVPSVAEFDIVVNASTVGMRANDPLPFSLSGATRDLAVADVITKPAMSRLLQEASALGCQIHSGLQLTKGQIPLQAEFFGLPGDDWTV